MARRAVMVVDPDPSTSRKLEKALQGSALDVIHLRTLQEALDACEGSVPVAVLSAISLPTGNGYDLARRLQQLELGVPVFLLWGGFEILDAKRAEGCGVRAGIRKPLTADVLLDQLEGVLGEIPQEPPVPEQQVAKTQPTEPEEILPVGSIEYLDTGPVVEPGPQPEAIVPPVGDERIATFVPNDYDSLPPVKLDREQLSVAMERAILAVLPEVLEAVLNKALLDGGRLRGVVNEVVAEVVRESLPELLRKQLGEPESGG